MYLPVCNLPTEENQERGLLEYGKPCPASTLGEKEIITDYYYY